ncbi:MAG: tetratricopeptide repeat protein [Myxococcales bacterium]|nr:tetratricopeptide repeat protein [Myxococcales bacterium]
MSQRCAERTGQARSISERRRDAGLAWSGLFCVVVGLLLAPPAAGQGAEPQAAPPSPATTAATAPPTPAQLPLKELTEQGIRQFQHGEFDAAIESFSAAHVVSPNPMFLFNIAQAHRKAGRPREALTHYQLFLRKSPDSPLRPETEAYIALVEAQLQAKQHAAQTVQSPAGHERTAAEPPTPAPAPGKNDAPTRPVYKRAWFYGVLAGSAVAVGLAVGLGVYFGTRPPSTTLGIVDPVF